MATAEPSPAAVMTWARGLVALPAAQTPSTLVRPSASTRTRSPRPAHSRALRPARRVGGQGGRKKRAARGRCDRRPAAPRAGGRRETTRRSTGPSTTVMARASSVSRSPRVMGAPWRRAPAPSTAQQWAYTTEPDRFEHAERLDRAPPSRGR
jgi:hypothetical protein